MSATSNTFGSISRKPGKSHTFMPLLEYKAGSITADKPPKEYEIKNPKAEDGQQSMKYNRQYLTLNDPAYPGLNMPVFVSRGKLTIMKFTDNTGKVNWSCFFSLTPEEQKKVADIMNDLYKILIQNKDFYGLTVEDLEENEDPNKVMMRIAKKKLGNIAKYPKDKTDKKKEDKSKPPFLSSKIKDDITECFFLGQGKDGKKGMLPFDYHTMEKKTFEAARYIHIRDIYTSKEPSVQVFMKKITMLEPPTTSLNIDDEYDEFSQSMYNEVSDDTVSGMAAFFQNMMTNKSAGLSSSSSGPGGEEGTEIGDNDSVITNSKPKGSFSSQLGKGGLGNLQFEKSASNDRSSGGGGSGGDTTDDQQINNFSSPIITQRQQTPILATTNPLGMSSVTKGEIDNYINNLNEATY